MSIVFRPHMIHLSKVDKGGRVMEYYERIKNLRIDNDKTQKELAALLGTGQSYYAKYENGHRPLPIDRLRDLCLYYNVSADYILGLPEGMPYGHSKTKKRGTK